MDHANMAFGVMAANDTQRGAHHGRGPGREHTAERHVTLAEPGPLDPACIDDAAGVLVRAFAADPGLRFVLPDAAERERLGPSLARAVLRCALRCGVPLATPGTVRGAGLWFPPDAPTPTEVDLKETGLAAVPALIGAEAWGRFRSLLDHVDALHPHYAPDPHWYLAMLGVDPAWQRQRIGESLMRPVFAAADRAGVCCYLEAPTEDNAHYYARRGFRVVGETDIPGSDVHVWLMRREPARQRRRSTEEI
jgi:ribosomal protein S18 acetylase RimI-like enzyme